MNPAGKYDSVNCSLASLYRPLVSYRCRVAPILTLWERLLALPSAQSSKWLSAIVCHSLLILRNWFGHLLTLWAEVKWPNVGLINAFSLNDGGNRDALWTDSQQIGLQFRICQTRTCFCMIWLACSFKCQISWIKSSSFLFSLVVLGHLLSFIVIPHDSPFSLFHHNQDFLFSTYWQLRDRRIRFTLQDATIWGNKRKLRKPVYLIKWVNPYWESAVYGCVRRSTPRLF